MLTEKRRKMLEFIASHQRRTGRVPTVREIAAAFGLKSTNGVHEHLRALERDGYLSRDGRIARGISLTQPAARGVAVLGEVAAGDPIFPVLDEGDAPALPSMPAGSFALRVRGDSMAGAGIASGDLVVVDPGAEARSGDIVVALLDGEVTLKRLHVGRKGVTLLPENAAYGPIAVDDRPFRVLGRAVRLIRSL